MDNTLNCTLLTVDEVSEVLKVDPTTTRRWIKQGSLEAVILPHVNKRQAYRIKRETLEKILGERVELAEDLADLTAK